MIVFWGANVWNAWIANDLFSFIECYSTPNIQMIPTFSPKRDILSCQTFYLKWKIQLLYCAFLLLLSFWVHFDNLRRQIPFREEQTSWHFNEMMQSFKRATKTHTYCVCVSMRPNMFFLLKKTRKKWNKMKNNNNNKCMIKWEKGVYSHFRNGYPFRQSIWLNRCHSHFPFDHLPE